MADSHHTHLPAPDFPPKRREAKRSPLYGICRECAEPIAQFRPDGRWVRSTNPRHPYAVTVRRR